MNQPQDANDLLMNGGTPSVKWEGRAIGHTVIGTITDQPKAVQMTKYQSSELDYWPSGDPKMEIICVVQTDERDPAKTGDDGRRRLHITPRMQKPLREAVQRVGAPGLAIGGRIAFRWISGTGVGEGNAREFAADYAPPVVDPGSLLGANGGQPAAQSPLNATAPAQPAPAAQAPGGGVWLGQQAAQQQAAQAAQAPGLFGTPGAVPPPPITTCPPGVDPGVWAQLPETQKQAVLAAMANPAASAPPF